MCISDLDRPCVQPYTLNDDALVARLRTRKRICVKELIDHVIAESDALYAGTKYATTYFIYHDALTAWWEKEAQDYLEPRGFKKSRLRELPAHQRRQSLREQASKQLTRALPCSRQPRLLVLIVLNEGTHVAHVNFAARRR